MKALRMKDLGEPFYALKEKDDDTFGIRTELRWKF